MHIQKKQRTPFCGLTTLKMTSYKFCDIQQFKINENKTQTVIFNSASLKDFSPNIRNQNGDIYKNVEDFKLLGVDLSSDKKRGIHFDNYIDNCIKKGYKKLWTLRRLAELGVSKNTCYLHII